MMNLQMEPVTKRETRKQLKKRIVVAACGTALTVTVLAGIGVWSSSGGTAHDATSKAVAPAADRATVASAARAAQYPTYYLVASQEQADRLEFQIQSDLYVSPLAVVGTGHVIVVVNSPQDEARARQAVDEGQIAAEGAGGPRPQLVDLRTP